MDTFDLPIRELTDSGVAAHGSSTPQSDAGWHLRRYLSSLKTCPPEEVDMKTVDEMRSVLMGDMDDDDLFFSASQPDTYFRLSEEFGRCFIGRDGEERKGHGFAGLRRESVIPATHTKPHDPFVKKNGESCSSLDSPRPSPEGNSCKETANDIGGDDMQCCLPVSLLPLRNRDLVLTEEEKYFRNLLTNLPKHPPPPYPGQVAAGGKEGTRKRPTKPKRTLASYLFSEVNDKREKRTEIAREHGAPLDKYSQHPTRTTSFTNQKAQRSPGQQQMDRPSVSEWKQGGVCHCFFEEHKRGHQHVPARHQHEEGRHRKQRKCLCDHDRMRYDCSNHVVGHTGLDVAKGERIGRQREVKKSLRTKKLLHPASTMKNYGVI